jgi:hypothetical protein
MDAKGETNFTFSQFFERFVFLRKDDDESFRPMELLDQ